LIKLAKIWFILLLLIHSGVVSFASNSGGKGKRILLINSYHQGYAWTDSLTTGIIKAVKLHPELHLSVETLDSKQFGKLNFEVEKDFLQKKYAGLSFDGVLVTDNDALDFAFQYDDVLFPNVPIVFAGITNPEDYPLDGSFYYGLKETGGGESVLPIFKDLFPEMKRILVITDKTTTGLIHRHDFTIEASKLDHLSVGFPEVIDLDSIYRQISSGTNYDAVFYVGINQDMDGVSVNPLLVAKKICELAKVPLFTNDLLYYRQGMVGGLFRNGENQGIDAGNLLIKLIDSNTKDSIKHVYTTEPKWFFDRELLNTFQIPKEKLPPGSVIFNKKNPFSRERFGVLITILFILGLTVVVLTVINQRRKRSQKRSVSQLREIETQKRELEEAHEQLSSVISELEHTNQRLKDTNVSLLEAKKKAEESDNLKSAFLANVSHELRTPLNSIVGFSSLLIEPDLSEETKIMYADMIESNTESLLVLIDEIIDLSKIEAQQLTLKKQDFCIDGLMEELFQIFNHGLKNPAVTLRTNRISPDVELFVFSDRVRVKQVFVNMLTNALKFTDSGFVEMGYSLSESKEIVLYVKDSGIGISKEFHTAIFHRFRKLNENSGRVYRGTGLGLAITQKLVELLGGKIWIESEPGKGSTFYFTLQDCMLKSISNDIA